jgi:long-chain acyl-CoA synthetase
VEKLDVSSVKGCFSGAPAVEVLGARELTGAKITEGFGMTETSPVTHGNPLNGLRKPGTVGVPLPDTDQRVVDLETGSRELPIVEEGELCIRGPQVMAGYWNRPEETAHTLVDGWVHTGDLARIDEDGYCTIVGSQKDMIAVSGFRSTPTRSMLLFAHPAVLEAATIGLPTTARARPSSPSWCCAGRRGHRAKSDRLLPP